MRSITGVRVESLKRNHGLMASANAQSMRMASALDNTPRIRMAFDYSVVVRAASTSLCSMAVAGSSSATNSLSRVRCTSSHSLSLFQRWCHTIGILNNGLPSSVSCENWSL